MFLFISRFNYFIGWTIDEEKTNTMVVILKKPKFPEWYEFEMKTAYPITAMAAGYDLFILSHY